VRASVKEATQARSTGAPAPDGDLLAHDLPALGIAGDQPKEPR